MKLIGYVSIAGCCLAIGLLWNRYQQQKYAVTQVDFDLSMRTQRYGGAVKSDWGCQVMGIMRLIYNRAWKRYDAGHIKTTIPPIIHQIWLGSPLPETYDAWQRSWQAMHPDWEYHLWTDQEVEKLLHNTDIFVGDTASFYREAQNYGERSDILRLVLLRHFGGLYVDMDFECLKSFDSLHAHFDFFIGVQPLDVITPQLGSALIGAVPHHPFIEFCIKELAHARTNRAIIYRTGPLFMTRSLIKFASRLPARSIVLPAGYLYPRAYNDLLEDRDQWIQPESYAVHHWSGSWIKPEAFVPRHHAVDQQPL